MKEYEVRILEVDPDRIHAKLLHAGARVIPKRRILTKSYAFPQHTFSRDVWARLRFDEQMTGGESWQLSLKSRVPGEDTEAEETALDITDPEAAEKILGMLGAVLRREIEKYRTTYLLNEVHFDVECFSLIPPYLEVEGPSQQAVAWGLEVVGYSLDQVFRGKSVFQHYGVDSLPRVY